MLQTVLVTVLTALVAVLFYSQFRLWRRHRWMYKCVKDMHETVAREMQRVERLERIVGPGPGERYYDPITGRAQR